MTSTNPPSASPQSPKPNVAPRQIYRILAGQLFDSVSRTLLKDQIITVDSDAGVILDVAPLSSVRKVEDIIATLASQSGVNIDLKSLKLDIRKLDFNDSIVLPGLVDVHVHFFLHPYSETSWDDQLTKESLAERTVRATVHARQTLLAGFTTVRDLGTEGAFDADIGLRKCLAEPGTITLGPRYFCSTRAIISSGSYGPRSSLYPHQEGIDGVRGAEPVDGVEECVKEVRKQIGAGADWIKVYADYRYRARQSDVSTSIAAQNASTFTTEELSAIIKIAHARGVKVAAHANNAKAINNLLDLGVDSIEHGMQIYDPQTHDKALLRKLFLARERTTWVPTLSAFYTLASDAQWSGGAQVSWERAQATFKEALKGNGENIACGGDTGVFAHGENALELILMRRLGARWEQVLGWATYGGWKCVRGLEWEGESGERKLEEAEKNAFRVDGAAARKRLEREVPFGIIRTGWAADLLVLSGKIDGTEKEFEDALLKQDRYVIKGGKLFRRDGTEIPPI
ncbi:unnamed protein product [Cyclocybe aegerita]|uniref:Amidohydrolase-related domain-containing protein n=1 Tax=Cyclocybe aegerita TaxID=1973307 RepID=A0A8S0VWB8_CYCAE|nr:unnamed protein product [Cyclocybe aegerita]